MVEQLGGERRQAHAQDDGGDQSPEDHLAAHDLRHARRGHADDDDIVARQNDVDQHDLDEREETAVTEREIQTHLPR